MIKLKFTPETIDQLHHERTQHPHPRVRQWMEAVYLKIEHLWKFVKKQCLYSHYYEAFADFKQAIEQCLADVSGNFKAQLTSLLTLNFQTFENVTL